MGPSLALHAIVSAAGRRPRRTLQPEPDSVEVVPPRAGSRKGWSIDIPNSPVNALRFFLIVRLSVSKLFKPKWQHLAAGVSIGSLSAVVALNGTQNHTPPS